MPLYGVDETESKGVLALALEANDIISRNIYVFRNKIVDKFCINASDMADVSIESLYKLAIFYLRLFAATKDEHFSIESFAESHNSRVSDLLSNKIYFHTARREALLRSIFTSDVMPRLAFTWNQYSYSIDQSNIARFMATELSTETVRKVIIFGERYGMFVRSNALGVVIVKSTGVLEQVVLDTISETMRSLYELGQKI
ncbi:hypothetical protein [Methylosinus sp. LW4]|uniref:hypothetical protein n=1 Tax=Methylosinus sp. LW4 TaxID=136993 RepID=UPI0012F7C6C9|nr:hypothetical protein [Methylosinus sp. LW4]